MYNLFFKEVTMKKYEAPDVDIIEFEEICLAELFDKIYISNIGIEDGGNI